MRERWEWLALAFALFALGFALLLVRLLSSPTGGNLRIGGRVVVPRNQLVPRGLVVLGVAVGVALGCSDHCSVTGA